MKREMNQLIGTAMFAVGAVVFLVAGFMKDQSGSVPAAAFLIIILAIGCYFPGLFQDGSSAPSTLRICVLMIVAVFTVMVVKTGWTATNFLQTPVHESWIYLLGLAFGAKALQSFAEMKSGRLGKLGGVPPTVSSSTTVETVNVERTNGTSTDYTTLRTERNALAGNPDDDYV